MRYYLAISRRNATTKYLPISLKSLATTLNKPSLMQDNNLKELYAFTTNFSSKKDLVNFLIKEKLLTYHYQYADLIIIYQNKKSTYTLPIAYQKDLPYFKFPDLLQIIKDTTFKNNSFLPKFLAYYNKAQYQIASYYRLLDLANSYYTDAELFDALQDFLNNICYYNNKGKLTFRFKTFYETALLVSSLITSPPQKENKPTSSSLSETQQIEAEYLKSRRLNDDQIRWF